MEWKTNARFGQDEKDGTIFTSKATERKCAIHQIWGCGKKFYLSCPALEIRDFGLNTEDFDAAVANAKVVIREKLDMLNRDFNAFLSDETETKIVRW